MCLYKGKVDLVMAIRKPRPHPAKAQAAFLTLTEAERKELADKAIYVGSPHHTDIPKFGLRSAPRDGATTIEAAEADNLKNPDCVVCPRKWARRGCDATMLLRAAIQAGTFVSLGAGIMPSPVWAQDPECQELVYEAKLLTSPPNGYKAYPLTCFQVEYNIPFVMP